MAQLNIRRAGARSKVTSSNPLRTQTLSYALPQVMSVTAPAHDRYLPARSETAQWDPVTDILAFNAKRCKDAACRKLVFQKRPRPCWSPLQTLLLLRREVATALIRTRIGAWSGRSQRPSTPVQPVKPGACEAPDGHRTLVPD